MDFKSWLAQTKIDEPELNAFITKLDPFFTDAGFNGIEFEKKVLLGLMKINSDIDETLKPETDAENK
jgi:hypothetical protein